MNTIDEPRAWKSRRVNLYVQAMVLAEQAAKSGQPSIEVDRFKKWAYRGLFAPFGWRRGWEIWLRFDCWTTKN